MAPATDNPASGRRRREGARRTVAGSPPRDGRGGRGGAVRQAPWAQPELIYDPVRLLSDDQVEDIHQASLQVLARTGLEVQDSEAVGLLRAEGCTVDPANNRVRFDPAFIESKLALAPKSFTFRARDPAKSLHIGGRSIVFSPVGGPAFLSTLDKGRHPGSIAEVGDFVRLVQSLNAIHTAAYGCVPMVLPAESRHLDIMLALTTLSDKAIGCTALGRTRVMDEIAMMRILHGEDEAAFARSPSLSGIINTNSPLKLDGEMAQGLLTLARAGQVVIATPFTLAGAMSPVTLAGALVQQNAEALAMIALAQTARAGAPVIYGAFTSNVDMRSGAPAFGTPVNVRAAFATGQVVRRYGLPYRSHVATVSCAVDAQAAYESQMSLWGSVMGGANVIMPTAGWLESGLTTSFEKLIVDAESAQLVAGLMQPIATDTDSLAVAAIDEVGPGGHFFGVGHTIERYETAFYSPMLSDWRNFESWQEAGSEDAAKRANAIWHSLLAAYEPPALDDGIRDGLSDYVARRKRDLANPI
ncbi:MAG: trimethylamine methyltransferase family protein [Alphaproteobacteria bacterium]